MSGLEDAFEQVAAALPEGWIIRSLVHDGMTWDAAATPYGTREPSVTGLGDTPTDALRDLAARLVG